MESCAESIATVNAVIVFTSRHDGHAGVDDQPILSRRSFVGVPETDLGLLLGSVGARSLTAVQEGRNPREHAARAGGIIGDHSANDHGLPTGRRT
jgi:hypothetical protein